MSHIHSDSEQALENATMALFAELRWQTTDRFEEIVGPRTVEQLEGSLRAVEIKLSDDVLKKLDEIFPGPGGEAPEAYAW